MASNLLLSVIFSPMKVVNEYQRASSFDRNDEEDFFRIILSKFEVK